MVQVDVFWSFGIGAGFAAAASAHIGEKDDPFEGKHFVKTLIYLSCFFVPSGAILLWGFPEWETMQVGTYQTIPAWLVGVFTLTNVTQGILGYWLAWKFIRRGNPRVAWMLCGLGYFLMFFILVHGWDGTGYQRFFYSCSWWGSSECVPWTEGSYSVLRWTLSSPVAWTLYAMGAVMIPVMLYWMSDWVIKGYEKGEGALAGRTGHMAVVKVLLRLVFVHILGAAIVASLLVLWLGWWLGVPLFCALAYLLMLRPGGITDKEIRKIIREPAAS